MAEKRQREEIPKKEEENSKRHKPYDQILSILEEEDDDYGPNTAQQAEMGFFTPDFGPVIFDDIGPDLQVTGPESPVPRPNNEDDDRIDVIRHLLEASDDELGIPNTSSDGGAGDGGNRAEEINGQDFPLAFCDGFWEFEDEAANYYSLLQSQLFM